MLGLGVRQSRCRFIHDQDAGVLRQRLGDFDDLLLRHTKCMNRRVDGDIGADHAQHALGFAPDFLAIDGAGDLSGEFTAEIDILGNAEIRHKREFLEDHGNAELARIQRRFDLDFFAVMKQFAFIGNVSAAEHLHQRRFAGAVLAAQHMNFAGPDRKRYVVERADAGERLADAAQLKQRRRRVAACLPRRHGRDVRHARGPVNNERRCGHAASVLKQMMLTKPSSFLPEENFKKWI